MKSLLALLLFILISGTSVQAQQTVINDYAAVLSYDACNNRLVVDTATQFSVGDTILLIQMKGAVIDTTNTVLFGDVLNYHNAGNYEFNTVAAKTGNILTLKYSMQRSYDIPDGKVQIVRVPFYQNYTVTQTHTCAPWNGSKGGVFALIVGNNLALNADIDVSGKGFRGGQITGGNTFACDFTDYFYPAASNDAGEKGEGIAEVSAGKARGKGKLANGGGGGNNTNCGGGGGGNGGAGGDGGHQWVSCNTALASGGSGGAGLVYSAPANRLFLGGGGGTGQENNNDTDPGGNGGGIAIVSAGNMIGPGGVFANGADCVDANALFPIAGDGQSGGGGAGAILINAASFFASPVVEAKGGNGGNIYAPVLHGPGAGGGGGSVLFSTAALPAASVDVSGGANGIHISTGNAHFAQPGQAGVVISGFPFNLPVDSFVHNLIPDFTDSTVACLTRQFINLSTGAATGVLWDWSFGDGGTSALKDPVHAYAAGGVYNVRLIVTDTLGCSDSIVKQVVLDTMNYNVTDSSVGCHMVQLTAVYVSGNAATGFQWLFGDGSTAPGNPVTHNYAAAGSYLVTLVVTDSLGCTDSIAYGVAVTDIAAGFTVLDDTVCQGASVSFTNTSSTNATVFAWNFGDGGPGDSTINTAHIFADAGIYTVRLIVASGEFCTDTAYRTIIADSAFALDFYLSDSSLCEGRAVTFNATIAGDSTFRGILWNFGDGPATVNYSPAVHAFDTSGTYTVKATASFRRCPASTVSHALTIRPYPRIDLGRDTSLCLGGQAILIADNTNALNPAAAWSWNTGDSTSRIMARHPGIYTARVEINGCAADDSVEVFKDCYIDVPNAFTPDGDGVNDYFFPRQLLSGGVLGFKMSIYNRWGQLIFETTSPDGRGWDGRFNGVEQPQGVFIYLIEVILKNGAHEKYQGNISLLR